MLKFKMEISNLQPFHLLGNKVYQ